MISDMWDDGAEGKFIVIIIIGIIIACSAFVGGCIQNEMNHLDSGRVIEKTHVPAYFIWISTGNSGYMQYIPDSYGIIITNGVKKYSTSTNKETYDSLELGYDYYNK